MSSFNSSNNNYNKRNFKMSYYNNPYYATNPSLNSLTSNTDFTIPKPAKTT